MTAKIALSQFLNFGSKIHTDAKINYVKTIKYTEYTFGGDYYRKLREAIRAYTQGKGTIDQIMLVVDEAPDDRKANLRHDARKFINFVTHHDVSFFEVGHAKWKLDDRLIVSASPEFGMIYKGHRFIVKNYYRQKDLKDRVTLRKMRPTLTLMRTAVSDVDTKGANAAILNLQTGKLIVDENPVNENSLLALRIDASNLYDIWTSV